MPLPPSTGMMPPRNAPRLPPNLGGPHVDNTLPGQLPGQGGGFTPPTPGGFTPPTPGPGGLTPPAPPNPAMAAWRGGHPDWTQGMDPQDYAASLRAWHAARPGGAMGMAGQGGGMPGQGPRRDEFEARRTAMQAQRQQRTAAMQAWLAARPTTDDPAAMEAWMAQRPMSGGFQGDGGGFDKDTMIARMQAKYPDWTPGQYKPGGAQSSPGGGEWAGMGPRPNPHPRNPHFGQPVDFANMGGGTRYNGPFGGDNTPFGGFRAKGGGWKAGKAYVVGEQGPEVVVPETDGTVIPTNTNTDTWENAEYGVNEYGGKGHIPGETIEEYFKRNLKASLMGHVKNITSQQGGGTSTPKPKTTPTTPSAPKIPLPPSTGGVGVGGGAMSPGMAFTLNNMRPMQGFQFPKYTQTWAMDPDVFGRTY